MWKALLKNINHNFRFPFCVHYKCKRIAKSDIKYRVALREKS